MGAIDMISFDAPAKVNLFLAVTDRRPDGYHELASLMQKLALADTVILGIKPGGSGIELRCPDSSLPEDGSNLAYRAAALFCEKAGLDLGVHIELHKRIPTAAGLGGGSSDAAAVLRGLNELLRHPLDLDTLLDMALSLGADVPFFVFPHRAAWARGVGERLTPVASLANCSIVLANPGVAVSTKEVYEAFDRRAPIRPHSSSNLPALEEQANFALTMGGNLYIVGRDQIHDIKDESFPAARVPLWNDLEAVTSSRYPEIGEIEAAMIDCGAAGALMSGSGPTVFAIFFDRAAAESCYRALSDRFPGGVWLTTPLA